MNYLIGTYECKIDVKGRLLIPSAFKKQLAPVIPKGFVLKRAVFQNCLELYPLEQWEELIKKVNSLNRFKNKNKLFNIMRGSFLVDEKSTSNWIYIFLFLILSLVMISSSHSVDQKVYKIASLNEEIKSLRSEFVDTRTRLMIYKMESSVKNRLSQQGIKSSKTPPVKIVINVNN